MRHPLLVLPLASVLAAAGTNAAFSQQAKISVCVTTPDLESIVKSVGGDEVEVTSFTRGPQDPHFVEARPSFVRALHGADLFVSVGLDLEAGWAPRLVAQARNPRVQAGAPGNLDASAAVTPLQVPAAPVDRSAGDIHPSGNPHYLLDPLNGIAVARRLRDRLAELRPGSKDRFGERCAAFERRISTALLGERLVARYGAELPKLLLLLERGGTRKLVEFLTAQGERDSLGGWLGLLAPYSGAKAIGDHNLWPYFARRFGIEVVGHMEPKPGITPSTRHLGELVALIQAQGVELIFSSAYFNERHSRFLAAHSSAVVVPLAHQTGGRPGTEGYEEMVEHNVRQVAKALADRRRAAGR